MDIEITQKMLVKIARMRAKLGVGQKVMSFDDYNYTNMNETVFNIVRST